MYSAQGARAQFKKRCYKSFDLQRQKSFNQGQMYVALSRISEFNMQAF